MSSAIPVTVPTHILEEMPDIILRDIRSGLIDIKSASMIVDFYKRYYEMKSTNNFHSFTDKFGCIAGMCVKITPTETEDVSIWWFLSRNRNTFTIIPCKFISNEDTILYFDHDRIPMRSRFISSFPYHNDILSYIHSTFLSTRWITRTSLTSYEEAERIDLYS
jgi:hypothetical protein